MAGFTGAVVAVNTSNWWLQWQTPREWCQDIPGVWVHLHDLSVHFKPLKSCYFINGICKTEWTYDSSRTQRAWVQLWRWYMLHVLLQVLLWFQAACTVKPTPGMTWIHLHLWFQYWTQRKHKWHVNDFNDVPTSKAWHVNDFNDLASAVHDARWDQFVQIVDCRAFLLFVFFSAEMETKWKKCACALTTFDDSGCLFVLFSCDLPYSLLRKTVSQHFPTWLVE